MKLFVTGGTGFIGSHFLNAAHAAGHEIVALRRSPTSEPRVPLVREPAWVESALAEVTVEQMLGCNVVVHFAAAGVLPRENDWASLFEINVSNSLKLWLRAIDAGIDRLVICGSCFEYGKAAERYEFIPVDAPLEPTGPYHASKAAASLAAFALARQKGLRLSILRPFHVFGDGEATGRFWPSLRDAARAGRDFPMTRGEQVRDFISVQNVASAFLADVECKNIHPGEPRIENIGSGRPTTLRAFAEVWWGKWAAQGNLLFGALPYRDDEVMRYVPKIN